MENHADLNQEKATVLEKLDPEWAEELGFYP
jgi:hypothetical protein